MNLPIWHIDAFTSQRFAGNPAAVVPLERWLSDDVLRAIAAENNLSEEDRYRAVRDAKRFENWEFSWAVVLA